MPHIQKSILINYSAEQMFILVADVEKYPEFLPWCSGTELGYKLTAADGTAQMDATVLIDYHGIRSRFTTHNEFTPVSEIQIKLVDGPFRSLLGIWRFSALRTDACKVELDMAYEFQVGLLGLAVAPVFEYIANSMIDSFAARAVSLYGTP